MGRRVAAPKEPPKSWGMTCKKCGKFLVNERLPNGQLRNLALCTRCDAPLVVVDERCEAYVRATDLSWEDE